LPFTEGEHIVVRATAMGAANPEKIVRIPLPVIRVAGEKAA